MMESWEELAGGLELLSNYFQKNLRFAKEHGASLRIRLEERGRAGRVHLWRKAHNYRYEMTVVAEVAEDPAERLTFLGTYYALQVFHIHLLNVHQLRRESAAGNRLLVYTRILMRTRYQLKDLVGSYLEALAGVFAPDVPLEGVSLCNVGMILDQEDLDVGVFIRPDVDKGLWNTVVSRIGAEFMKYSPKMHFYLAEKVAGNTYLTTIEDFENYLRRGVHNFVLISELLLTEPLLGDGTLADELERAVILPFFYTEGKLRFHEGYLRGMIGEVRELTRSDAASSWVSPKNRGLRLIHNIVNMLKTIHGVRAHGSRDGLTMLCSRDTPNLDLYQKLQDIFSFTEIFFYVYQLLVSMEDAFDLSDQATLENLDNVAGVMGFSRLGAVRPAQRLLTHYYENMDQLNQIAETTLGMVNNHLRRITIFNEVLRGGKPDDYPVKWTDNVVLNVLQLFKTYHGLIYWEDILQLLAEKDGELCKALIRSLDRLDEPRRTQSLERLLRFMSFDMVSLVHTILLIDRHTPATAGPVYAERMKNWLVRHVEADPRKMKALVDLLPVHPSMLTDFLLTLSFPQLAGLRRLARRAEPGGLPEDGGSKRFSALCELLSFSSKSYLNLFARVARTRREIVTAIDRSAYLERIADQLWNELADAATPEELKDLLAFYYDFNFCRCGLLAIAQPGDLNALYGTYHGFFRRYFRWLYRACQWDVETRGKSRFLFRLRDEDDQPMAIYCTGGYAREEAFENDVDLLVVSRETDPEFIRYASDVMNEINRELSRRGVVPHYRFTRFHDAFVIPLAVLEASLGQPREADVFIELSQLLGRRLLLGSLSLGAELTRLVERFVYSDPGPFIADILREMEENRRYMLAHRERSINVKEDPGALREIQMIIVACQAFLGNRELVVREAILTLVRELPDLEPEFNALGRAYHFLRFFKEINALSLSGDDDIMKDRLLGTAHRMGLEPGEISGTTGTAPRLMQSYNYHRSRARKAIARITGFLRAPGRPPSAG